MYTSEILHVIITKLKFNKEHERSNLLLFRSKLCDLKSNSKFQ